MEIKTPATLQRAEAHSSYVNTVGRHVIHTDYTALREVEEAKQKIIDEFEKLQAEIKALKVVEG